MRTAAQKTSRPATRPAARSHTWRSQKQSQTNEWWEYRGRGEFETNGGRIYSACSEEEEINAGRSLVVVIDLEADEEPRAEHHFAFEPASHPGEINCGSQDRSALTSPSLRDSGPPRLFLRGFTGVVGEKSIPLPFGSDDGLESEPFRTAGRGEMRAAEKVDIVFNPGPYSSPEYEDCFNV